MPQVRVVDIYKNFGAFRAINGISFDFDTSEFVSLLGENGAGKSTLLTALSGLLRPDSGEILFDGKNIFGPGFVELRKVGVVLQQPLLYSNLTVRENLDLFGTLLGLGGLEERISRLAEELDLGDELGKQIRHCSQGIRKRASLSRAFLGDPQLLILDEPFSHLDPVSQDKVSRLLLERHRRGMGILLSSHEPQVIRGFDCRVIWLRRGRVISELKSSDLPTDVKDARLSELYRGIPSGVRN